MTEDLSLRQAEQLLTDWRARSDAVAAERDPLIGRAHAAGLTIVRIAELVGLSRVYLGQELLPKIRAAGPAATEGHPIEPCGRPAKS